jgi:hypothetical protein
VVLMRELGVDLTAAGAPGALKLARVMDERPLRPAACVERDQVEAVGRVEESATP